MDSKISQITLLFLVVCVVVVDKRGRRRRLRIKEVTVRACVLPVEARLSVPAQREKSTFTTKPNVAAAAAVLIIIMIFIATISGCL